MSILERLLKLSDDPDGMEKLYRQEPQAFRSVFQDALSKRPDSLLLQAWRARFEYVPERAATLRTLIWSLWWFCVWWQGVSTRFLPGRR